MILRICEFLISSVKLLKTLKQQQGSSRFRFTGAAACCGAVVVGVKFSISLLMIRPFSPEPFT
jgi:hypothetical protein